MSRDERGFTLLELLLALSLVAALLAIAFGGLRVAVAAWTRGEERAEAHQHGRALAVVIGRALGGAAHYRAAVGQAPEPVLLFRGDEHRVEFVTQTPPFPPGIPAAFTAVVIALEDDEGPALVIRQRVLPNREPFAEAGPILRDRGIAAATLRYLDEDGEWRDTWDGEQEEGLPRAVQITLATGRGGDALPPFTVSLRATPAAQGQ